jgi:hypothetical protein
MVWEWRLCQLQIAVAVEIGIKSGPSPNECLRKFLKYFSGRGWFSGFSVIGRLYVLVMDWKSDFSDSVDAHESRFLEATRMISRLQAIQLEELEWLDRAQVFTGDGSRNLSEWVAAKADLGVDTGRDLARTMRRTADKPWLRTALGAGAITFDRAEALSRIPEDVGTMSHLDVSGVRRAAADLVEITHEDEVRSAGDQYLILQPTLDQSWWDVRGGLEGVFGAAIDKALTEKADALPDLPDGETGSAAWRRAIALYELATGGESPQAHISVFVNADQAVESNGTTGMRLEAGPRVGAQALSAIFCDSISEITVNTADGVPLRYGRKSRGIPPQLRRATLARNHGFCQADGCNSRYRVEVHHIIPWSEWGRTDPENLVALCWFHHQIVVHQRGFEIYEDPESGRVRFRKPKHYELNPEPELQLAG